MPCIWRWRRSPPPAAPTWVAAIHKRWLASHLERLEKAGAFVDRVVPALWPEDVPAAATSSPRPTAPTAAARRPGSPSATPTACAARAWPAPGCAISCRAGAARAPAGARRQPWPRRPSDGSVRRWRCAPMPSMHCRRCVRCGTCGSSISPRGPAVRAGCAMRGAAPSQPGVAPGAHRTAAPGSSCNLVGINLWAWQQRSEIEQTQAGHGGTAEGQSPADRHHRRCAAADAPCNRKPACRRWTRRRCRPRVGLGRCRPGLARRPSAGESLRFESGKLTLVVGVWSADQTRTVPRRLRSAGWSGRVRRGPPGARVVRSRCRQGQRVNADLAPSWPRLRQQAAAAWRARAPRERIVLAAWRLRVAALLLWSLAVAPALAHAAQAPRQIESLDAQLQQMRTWPPRCANCAT